MKFSNKLFALSFAALALVSSSACVRSVNDGMFHKQNGNGGGGGNPPVDECDQDGDGFIAADCVDGNGHHGDDCRDNNANVHPGAPELCNGIDDNCNGSIDEGLAGCNPPADSDGDGDPDSTDCNDSNPAVHHGAPELCNGIDDNCNGSIDEGCGNSTDSDGDGETDATDCDDANPNIHHGHAEVCGNGIDDNCNGSIDEGCGNSTDSDGDGETDATDCDDANPNIHHGHAEVCGNGIDDNCNGSVDEGCGGGLPGTCPEDPTKSIDCVPCQDTVDYSVTVHADLADSLVLEGGTVPLNNMLPDLQVGGFNWVAVAPAVASTDAVFTFRGCREKSFRFQVTGEHIPQNGANQVAFTCTKPEYQISGLSPQIVVRRDGQVIPYNDDIVNWYPDGNGRNCQINGQ